MGRTVIAACAARVMDEPPPPPTDALLLQTYDWQRKAEAEVRKQTNKRTADQRLYSPAGPVPAYSLCVPHRLYAQYVCMAWHRRAN